MELDQAFDKFVSRFLEDIDTPVSLKIYLLWKHGELLQIASATVQPTSYLDSESFFWDNQACELLRKLDIPGVRPANQLETECFERLMATERLCAATNARMVPFLNEQGPFAHPDDLRICEVIKVIRDKIRYVCGALSDRVFDAAAFGPGSTLTNSRRFSTAPDKLESIASGTPQALFLYNTFFRGCAWDRAQRLSDMGQQQVVRGNRFFTVPKDATKLRGACLSPNVNGFLQKGVGSYLRARLRRVGINIKNSGDRRASLAPEMHRALAAHGSRWDTFATIDLSDASNTVSRNVVKLLFPREWSQLFDDLREPTLEGPNGSFHRLEMLSAMGNGFTFEVETILFYGIAAAFCDPRLVSVFGDDIVVPQHAAREVVAALRFFGFVTNDRKTFVAGPFRESCGGDFFNGIPVRAHYVKKIPSQPADWISLANGLRRLAYGSPVSEHRWTTVQRAWLCCLSALPVRFRALKGPVELEDAVIHDHQEFWTIKVRDSIRYVKALVAVGTPLSWDHFRPGVVLAAALYGCDQEGPIPRVDKICHRIKWIAYS